MKLEDQVCSLDLAKKLKELGIKQDSLFYYARFQSNEKLELLSKNYFDKIINEYDNVVEMSCGCCDCKEWSYNIYEIYSAFTASELLSLIPSSQWFVLFNINIKKFTGLFTQYTCKFIKDENILFESEMKSNLVDCLAEIIIYLIENGIIKNE